MYKRQLWRTRRTGQILDLGVVMLFYLEEDTFSSREVQSVVEALKGIGEWLRE